MENKFTKRLLASLKKQNISQAELSKRTGIRASSISDYINGKYIPKQDKVILIARVLHVKLSWLMGYEKDNTQNHLSLNTHKHDLKYLMSNTEFFCYDGIELNNKQRKMIFSVIQAILEEDKD